ncbi:hypothetical protein RHECNPAF_4310011 [Rhizobium etli CNPAF512]|nr:hypothetical protein RHECNPAF_4310011 [Rhizobium etli CNPAF512]
MCACAVVSFMTTSPQIEKSEDEDPDQVDEVPVEAHDLDGLVAAFPAREEAAPFHVEIASPDLAGNDEQEDDADRDVGAVKAGNHEKGRSELCCPPWVFPGAHALGDQLRPFEGLHADEGCAQKRRQQHQNRGHPAVAPIAEVDRHRHGAAARNQHEGHDRDQDQRHVRTADMQRENFARIGPWNGRRHAGGHIGDQETAEDESVAEQEDPHHRLAPGGGLEGALIRAEIGGDTAKARRPEVCPAVCLDSLCHLQTP